MGDRRLVLILGGARSGKSEFAEAMAAAMGGRVTYIATLAAGDPEMARRIAAHRERRPKEWITVEEARDVPREIESAGKESGVLLVDCLTGWISNLLLDESLPFPGASDPEKEAYVEARVKDLALAAAGSGASVIIVSNEAGMGLVPPYPLGRLFRDVSGKANRYLASLADEVYLVVAGLAVEIKSLAKAPWAGIKGEDSELRTQNSE
ncbi:MAG: bifunctional adenosylcobinamide kinase/adenosylcobinamide-phosphate guanylyltransferase [Bacillota bacterium]